MSPFSSPLSVIISPKGINVYKHLAFKILTDAHTQIDCINT